jgi:hypothetical protein
MQTKNKLVEEALIQMKQVEEAIAENAKGILASTMKQEINQLVKESLTEQEDEDEVEDLELDVDTDMSDDNEQDSEDEMDFDSEDEMDFDSEDEMDFDSDDEMDFDSDDEMDFDSDDEMDFDSDDEEVVDMTNASDEEILKVFKAMGEKDGIIIKKDGGDIHLSDEGSDVEYLVKLGESEEDIYHEMIDEEEDDAAVQSAIDAIFKEEMSEEDDDIVYEIEFEDDEMDEDVDLEESYKPKKSLGAKSIKPKGVGIGKGPKFSFDKALPKKGFSEDKKEGPKSVGTGKAKFEYKKGENMEGKHKMVKKSETKEASRTLGMGSNFRKGGLPKRRAHSNANTAIQKESLENEIVMLRTKNEEYRKALNTFREKLNEVAIFNSNLAYTTRLFTEHSTTKKEKLNILKRFDNVGSLKESKFMYKTIKDELGRGESKPITESVESKINKTVSTGSSTTLIESKTYENPQYLRMRDLMSKLGGTK